MTTVTVTAARIDATHHRYSGDDTARTADLTIRDWPRDYLNVRRGAQPSFQATLSDGTAIAGECSYHWFVRQCVDFVRGDQ